MELKVNYSNVGFSDFSERKFHNSLYVFMRLKRASGIEEDLPQGRKVGTKSPVNKS